MVDLERFEGLPGDLSTTRFLIQEALGQHLHQHLPLLVVQLRAKHHQLVADLGIQFLARDVIEPSLVLATTCASLREGATNDTTAMVSATRTRVQPVLDIGLPPRQMLVCGRKHTAPGSGSDVRRN